MANELRDIMAQLALSLVETVARLEQAEMDLLYVGVPEVEQRIEALHDALAFVGDSIGEIAIDQPAAEVLERSCPCNVVGPSNVGNLLAQLGIEATAGFGVS
jgi:hypothetical protein